MIVEYKEPIYGVNYKAGYVFGTNKMNDLVHSGIAYFQRWDLMKAIKCQHVGIVKDENTVIEAGMKGGVHEADIHELFENPCLQIFFRKPLGLTDDIANRIVGTASAHLGEKYDASLIVAHALVGTFLGRLTNKLSNGKLERAIASALDSPDEWICSELVADALDTQPEYTGRGVLAKAENTITPQELIQDNTIFEQWKDC